MFACKCIMYAIPKEAIRRYRSYKWFVSCLMGLLWTVFKSSRRAANALHCWVISLVHHPSLKLFFSKLFFSACIFSIIFHLQKSHFVYFSRFLIWLGLRREKKRKTERELWRGRGGEKRIRKWENRDEWFLRDLSLPPKHSSFHHRQGTRQS